MQNRGKSAVGQVILAGNEAEVAVIAPRGHGLADDDLEVALFVVPVPDVAAVDADDDRFLRERLAIIRTAFKANWLLAAKISFMAGGNLVQVAANGAGVGGAADRQNLFQQLGSQAEGNQRGPFRFQIQQLRGGVLGEQLAQRAEGLAGRRLTAAAVKARTVQRDGAEGGTELDPTRSLAQQGATAAVTAPMSGQEARRLGGNHALLDGGQHGLGVAKRQPDRLHAVVALVEMQNLVRADHAVVVTNDPELDLDTHARPNGCRCSAASLSAADAANYPRSPIL